MLIEFLDLLVNISLEAIFVEVVVEVLRNDNFLLVLELLRHLSMADALHLDVRRVVGYNVLLLLGLLVISL